MGAESTVTAFAQNRMFFEPSSRPFMTFAAIGAQLPFSMKPTRRFWYFRSTRWSMNVRMNGKMSALYVVVASTSLP